MALEIKLTAKLSQTLVMTPQLQQAIKLLQLGRLEYLEEIEREILENPVLESAGDSLGVSGEDYSFADSVGEGEINEPSYTKDNLDSGLSGQENPEINESSWEGESQLKIYEDFDLSERYPGGSSGRFNSDDEHHSLDATLSSPVNLVSHVSRQLRILDLDEKDFLIVNHILGNLDRNGYLAASLEEISDVSGCSLEHVERVLQIVHTLDPSGIAARDLRECLLIQLEERGEQECLAGRIVSNHLSLLEHKKYDAIAKAERAQVEDVYEAVKMIRQLEPCPAWAFVDEPPVYITPDIYVRKVGDEFVIQMNDEGLPRVKISTEYRQLVEEKEKSGKADREFIQDCLKKGQWLMRIMEQRQSTIFKVTQSIMQHQREFLEKGVNGLKPLVLREIAEDVGMHESTISRVTSNKYVHTPQGVFELKYFFSSGLNSDGGEVSSEAVKTKIKDLVAAENPLEPLSDQAIAEILKRDGIDIARRTVAKYREMSGILSSSRRKRLF